MEMCLRVCVLTRQTETVTYETINSNVDCDDVARHILSLCACIHYGFIMQ